MTSQLEIRLFPCLSDNYGFLVRDVGSGKTACVDTPAADTILAELRRTGWSLDVILNTHWHPDHIGGNEELKARTGAQIIAPEEVLRAGEVDLVVRHGDRVALGATEFQVIDVGGHTLGHVAYYAAEAEALFAGDALFPMGCGRLFEGTAAQMWESLQRLAALPARTTVYSAHEYTLANARFALSVDQDPAVAARAQAVTEARARQQATVPTTIAAELATNPFLRAPLLPIATGAVDAAAAFAVVRAAKDRFKG